jgi:hypothetical protein
MLRKLNPLLALAAGLIGGLASRYVTPFSVHAQAPTPFVAPIPPPPQPAAPAEIKAQSFTLVDRNGNTVGTFAPLVSGPLNRGDGVVLLDKNGRELWRATTSLVRPVGQ